MLVAVIPGELPLRHVREERADAGRDEVAVPGFAKRTSLGPGVDCFDPRQVLDERQVGFAIVAAEFAEHRLERVHGFVQVFGPPRGVHRRREPHVLLHRGDAVRGDELDEIGAKPRLIRRVVGDVEEVHRRDPVRLRGVRSVFGCVVRAGFVGSRCLRRRCPGRAVRRDGGRVRCGLTTLRLFRRCSRAQARDELVDLEPLAPQGSARGVRGIVDASREPRAPGDRDVGHAVNGRRGRARARVHDTAPGPAAGPVVDGEHDEGGERDDGGEELRDATRVFDVHESRGRVQQGLRLGGAARWGTRGHRGVSGSVGCWSALRTPTRP